jgi:hypothetical protein
MKPSSVGTLLISMAIALLVQTSASAQTVSPSPAASASESKGTSVTVAGTAFDSKIVLAGKTLSLNGAGVRTKFMFKIYAAGLYLPAPASTPAAVYAASGPKRMKVTFLRELDSTSFGKTTSQVMGDNLPREKFGKCIPGILKLGEVFANKKKMLAGEWYTLDEVPGQGTLVSINGQMVAEIAEREFFTCLMYNYFGDKPADTTLKAALLGQH